MDACTLPTEQQPLRLAEFDELLRETLRRVERPSATWLRLGLADVDGGHARALDLTARESACCSFFAFTVRRTDTEILLDVRVPAGRTDVVDGLHRQADEVLRGAAR